MSRSKGKGGSATSTGRTPIVVDGSNIAYLEPDTDGKPSVDAIDKVRRRLIDLGYRPIVIVDAALYHEVKNSRKLDHLVNDGSILQAPAGTDADYFVLKTAELENARIVSDDLYRDYQREFPDAITRRVPVMIVDGNVEFYHLESAADSRK